MEKALFSITCTTCRARLRVLSEEAVGAILECPKCGSMVQVTPPEGWQSEAQLAHQAAHPNSSVAEAADTAASESGPEVSAGAEAKSLGPVGAWVSPAELLWRKWLLLAAAPVASVVVVVGVWSIFFWRSQPELPPTPTVQQAVEPAPSDQPEPADKEPDPVSTGLDRRWLPDGTTLLLSFHPSQLAGRVDSFALVDQLEAVWRQTVGTLLPSLGLKLSTVGRLTWASTELAAWPQQSVVVIELESGPDAAALGAIGEAVDLSLDGSPCRRLPDAAWAHPFAVVNQRTIVTGDAQLLGRLAQRSEVDLESATFERLLKVTTPRADVTLLLDLAAARKANWKLPTALFDVWPPGKQPWHAIWKMSEGLGCTMQCSGRVQTEVVLACAGETAAEGVHAAVGELIPAVGKSLSAEVDLLPEKVQAGQMAAETAEQYGLLLREGLAASRAAQWGVADGVVWVRADWNLDPSALAAALVESRPAIQTGYLAAAREADKANHHRLLAGLVGHQGSAGHFPAATVGAARLPPERQLSWIAAMLPSCGYKQWHDRLEFAYPWNSPQNRQVTGQPLPEVVNPALGPSQTEAGFPVTHYVGVAGVGADAARLKADDPRAGVFGFARHIRPEDIPDGAANTIALLGVTKRLGPWAAGGDPTVRALTQPPYVNGPDGFGSGQPDGMLAGMADGSVRFISKEVDPRVLEQLATINGQEDPRAVAPNLKPDPPQPGPDEPEPDPEAPGEHLAEAGPDAPPEPPTDDVGETPEPKQLDVEAQLAETIPEIELREMPLSEAIDLLAGLSAVPMTFDPAAMQQLGVTLHDPVTVQLSGATVGGILESVVSSRGLAAVVENGHVLVTSPSEHREKLWRRPYTVSDLSGEKPEAVAELAELVQKLVTPDSWRRNGGRGTVEPTKGVLVVVQTGVVHHQILTFCEKLRNARGKPLRSDHNSDRFTLATRLARAKQVLGRPVTVNFHQPAPLIRILAYLGELGETDILVDRLALSAAGLSDQAEATLTVENQPLRVALEELLAPWDLRYRVIDARTLQVTTRKAITARLELEFYPAADLLAGARPAQALVEQIKGRVAGSTWSDAGGPGVLHVDQPSGCLIVLQSQPVQGELERLLAEWRN